MRRLILGLLTCSVMLSGTFLSFSVVHAYVFSGYLKPGDYSASHTINLPQDSALRVKVSHDPTLNPCYFEIQTPDDGKSVGGKKNLKFQTSGTEYGPFALKAGTYVIFITASWVHGGEGNYTLALTLTPTDFPNDKEPNNSFSEAQPITFVGFTTGHLGYYGKENDSIEKDTGDYFEFTLPGECDFFIEMNYDASLVGYCFAIYDSNEKWVLTEWLRTSGLGGVTWGPYRLEAGTYYVKMAGPWEKYGGYEFITIMDPKATASDPPYVSSTDPLPNETNVDIYYIKKNGIKVTFSQEMYRYSFKPFPHGNILMYEGDKDLYVSADPQDRVLWITPVKTLKPFTTYTCKVKSGETGVKDVEGQPLKTDFTWSFTTGKDPLSKQAFINAINVLLLLPDP